MWAGTIEAGMSRILIAGAEVPTRLAIGTFFARAGDVVAKLAGTAGVLRLMRRAEWACLFLGIQVRDGEAIRLAETLNATGSRVPLVLTGTEFTAAGNDEPSSGRQAGTTSGSMAEPPAIIRQSVKPEAPSGSGGSAAPPSLRSTCRIRHTHGTTRPGSAGGMALRRIACGALFLGAVSGCALRGVPPPEGGLVGFLQPPAFRAIIVARESVALSDVVRILVSKGYAVMWGSPTEIAAQYQVHPGQILAVSCVYLGRAETPAGSRADVISCTARDLATGERVYGGRAESLVVAGQTARIAEAIERALAGFPDKGGTGYVLSAVPLSPRIETLPARSHDADLSDPR
jgi:hypothetical protein